MDAETLKKIIAEGENVEVELKQSFHSVQDIAKDICAFANTQGGLLILGVKDNGTIEGLKGELDKVQQQISNANSMIHSAPLISVEILSLDNKKVVVAAVHKADSSIFHSVEGVIYVRIGSTIQRLEGQSIVEFLRNRQILLFDEAIEPSARLEDIDLRKVRAYMEKRGQPALLDSHSLKDFLISKKLVSLQPDMKLKSAALLFFAKDVQQFYPYTQIKLVRFDGSEPIKVLAYEDAKGSLPQLIDHSVNFVMRFVPKEFVIKDTQREEIPALPEEAVREAVINAVAHRDYFNKNEVQISVFDDRVEITNPGGLPEGMSKELLGALSIQRNPKIYQFLKDYGYMEGIGSGISKMYSLMRESRLNNPEFITTKEFFRAILRTKKLEKTVKNVADLSDRQLKGLEYLKQKGKVKSQDYASINKISTPTAIKDLLELEKKKLIKKIGKYKGAHYVLT
ncbi:putative DNA binding domain-containing protein [Candidatus Woesearchaeota archaeon]|nr:putative DNA binding domain-containing protein [Candidatus Woesearchaeota archaeon]